VLSGVKHGTTVLILTSEERCTEFIKIVQRDEDRITNII
jgi:hypothetical protein